MLSSEPNTEARSDHQTDLVLFKSSSIHGLGGFARVKIASGTAVLEYRGEKITKAESLRRCEQDNVFIFALNEREDIDGNVPWNPARWLNHSCSPNAEAQVLEDRIWLIAIRDIAPSEEITFNYGFDLENYQEYPCRCGAPNCVGYMVAEEFFDHVRGRNALQFDSAKPS
jgi:hypothetical protein